MNKSIAGLPGDGVGAEIISAAQTVLDSVSKTFDHTFTYTYGLIGGAAIDKTGDPFPAETEALCKQSDAILFGAIGEIKYDTNPSAKIRPEQGLLRMRKSLGLYTNLRPVKIYNELIEKSPLKDSIVRGTDFIVVRELTGGIYFGEPRFRRDNGRTAIDTSVYSQHEVERIAHVAFTLAMKRKKKLTSVDKANVLETSRLWRETVEIISTQYPEVEVTHMFVDNASMQLIKRPTEFDVILTENMFGDILTDEASVLGGSIGLLPSASIGDTYALYEPIHGSFPKAKGLNTANPIATIISAAMMLQVSFSLEREAASIEQAVSAFLDDGYRTKDLASAATTEEHILGTKETGLRIASYIKK